MKQLPLKTAQYRYLQEHFEHWLQTLGYAKTTVNSFPIHVREYLHHLENYQQVTQITEVKRYHSQDYIEYLYQRKNYRNCYSTGLSQYSINKNVVAINTFHKYLLEIRNLNLAPLSLRTRQGTSNIQILSVDEIKSLYEATYYESRENQQVLGQRDRAILSLLYGCGLRRKEAIMLDIQDVDFDKGELLIRNTKSKRERLVPMVDRTIKDIQTYLNEARPWFTKSHKQRVYRDRPKSTGSDKEALILNQRGQRLSSGYYCRFRLLLKRRI